MLLEVPAIKEIWDVFFPKILLQLQNKLRQCSNALLAINFFLLSACNVPFVYNLNSKVIIRIPNICSIMMTQALKSQYTSRLWRRLVESLKIMRSESTLLFWQVSKALRIGALTILCIFMGVLLAIAEKYEWKYVKTN